MNVLAWRFAPRDTSAPAVLGWIPAQLFVGDSLLRLSSEAPEQPRTPGTPSALKNVAVRYGRPSPKKLPPLTTNTTFSLTTDLAASTVKTFGSFDEIRTSLSADKIDSGQLPSPPETLSMQTWSSLVISLKTGLLDEPVVLIRFTSPGEMSAFYAAYSAACAKARRDSVLAASTFSDSENDHSIDGHGSAPAPPIFTPTKATGRQRPPSQHPPVHARVRSGDTQLHPSTWPPQPSIIAQLRRCRRKPELALRDPQNTWVLLIRAAHGPTQRGVNGGNSGGIGSGPGRPASRSRTDSFAEWPDGGPGDEASVLGSPAREPRRLSVGSAAEAGDEGEGAGGGAALGGRRRKREELSRVLRKHEWLALVPRYLPVLGDRYTASAVFDALTEGSDKLRLPMNKPISDATSGVGAGTNSGGIATALWRARTSSISGASDALGLPHSVSFVSERVLRFEAFERYCGSLARPLVTPPAAWEALREALQLDPREVCVKVEEFVEAEVCVVLALQPQQQPQQGPARVRRSRAPSATGGFNTISFPLPIPEALRRYRELHGPKRDPVDSVDGRAPRSLRQFIRERDTAQEAELRALYYDSDDTIASDDEGASAPGRGASNGRLKAGGRGSKRSSANKRTGVTGSSSTAPVVDDATGIEDHGNDGASSDSENTELAHAPRGDRRGQMSTARGSRGDEGGGGGDDDDDERAELEMEDALHREMEQLYGGMGMGEEGQSEGDEAHDDDGDDDGEGGAGAGGPAGDLAGSAAVARRRASFRRLGALTRFPAAALAFGGLAGPRPSLGGVASWIRTRGTRVLQSVTQAVSGDGGTGSDAGPGAFASVTGKPDLLAPYRGFGVHADVLARLLSSGRASLHLRGTLVLTDRNLYFHAPRGEVLVVPLGSLTGGGRVRLVRTEVTTLGMRLGRDADNGLRLSQCELRRVITDPDAEQGGSEQPCRTPLASLFRITHALTGCSVQLKAPHAPRPPATATSSGPPSVSTADSGVESEVPDSAANSDDDGAPLSGVSAFSLAPASATGPGPLPPPSAGAPTGVLAPRPTLTFSFSQLKDLVLGKRVERAGGGRRRVIFDALGELLASYAIAPEYERLLQEVVAAANAAAAERAGGGPTKAPKAAGGAALEVTASPHLLEAASRHISWDTAARMPLTSAAWKQLLQHRREHVGNFSRRLHQYAALNLVRSRALLKATGSFAPSLHLCSAYMAGTDERAAAAVKGLLLQDDPRAILALLSWASHERDVYRRRFEATSLFDRFRFGAEMAGTLDLVIVPINRARLFVYWVLSWERPLLSGCVLTLTLLCCWHDMLRYAGALWLLGHVAALLVYGALPEQARADIAYALGRDRGVRANNIIERLRNFRLTLGKNQARLHRLNTAAAKLRSLYTWRDPLRTKLFLAALVALAVLVAVVPARVLVASVALFAFTRPLRAPGKGVARLALERFWDGLPTPSVADAVYGVELEDSAVLRG